MNIKKVLGLGIITILLLSLSINFLPAVSAQEGSPPNGIDDMPDRDFEKGPPKGVKEGRNDFEKRSLEVGKHEKNAEVTSYWTDKNTDDEVNMNFDFRSGSPTFDFEYYLNKDSKTLRLSFQLVIEKIFEFKDTNGNGRYDGSDEIISEYVLEGKDFEDIGFDEDEEVYNFNTRTEDSVFKIRVVGGGEFMEVNGNTINPYTSKIDFEINYDFKAEDSMLGLKTIVKSEHPKEMGKHTFDEQNQWAEDESWLKLKHDNYSGFFSWQNKAKGDGEDVPVNVTFISESAVDEIGSILPVNDVLYFSYPRASNIVHDPKVGVVGESSLSYTATDDIDFRYMITVLAITMITASLVFSAGIYLRKRD